jgi:integrase
VKLTAKTVRTLTLPPGLTEKTFYDDALPGFGCRIRRSGSKVLVFAYQFGIRNRRLVYGPADALDFGKTRAAAKDDLAKVRLGIDPLEEKHAAQAKASDVVRFEGPLLKRFLDRQRKRLKGRSFDEVQRHLTVQAKPLHKLELSGITRGKIAELLADVDKASGPAAANRLRASLSAYFGWLIGEGVVENIEANPVSYSNKAIENEARERLLTDDELAAILAALGTDQYSTIVRLLALSAARREEIAGLRWSEIDLDRALITLPPERCKNGREHVIPLSSQALAILKAWPRGNRKHVFGRVDGRGFSDWSGSKKKLDARIAEMRGAPIDGWCLHDFRRAASTTLHEKFKIAPHVVEVILAHVGGHKAGVAGVYNKAIYLDERREALTKWADHLTALTGETAPAAVNVVKLRA